MAEILAKYALDHLDCFLHESVLRVRQLKSAHFSANDFTFKLNDQFIRKLRIPRPQKRHLLICELRDPIQNF